MKTVISSFTIIAVLTLTIQSAFAGSATATSNSGGQGIQVHETDHSEVVTYQFQTSLVSWQLVPSQNNADYIVDTTSAGLIAGALQSQMVADVAKCPANSVLSYSSSPGYVCKKLNAFIDSSTGRNITTYEYACLIKSFSYQCKGTFDWASQ